MPGNLRHVILDPEVPLLTKLIEKKKNVKPPKGAIGFGRGVIEGEVHIMMIPLDNDISSAARSRTKFKVHGVFSC